MHGWGVPRQASHSPGFPWKAVGCSGSCPVADSALLPCGDLCETSGAAMLSGTRSIVMDHSLNTVERKKKEYVLINILEKSKNGHETIEIPSDVDAVL